MATKKIKLTEAEALAIAISALSHDMARATHNPSPAMTEAHRILTKLHKKASKPRITVASAKAKGRSLQKRVRENLISQLNIDPKDVLSTPMGLNGCDIYLSKAARDRFPYGVEAKNSEKLNFWNAWDQATRNANHESLIPVLVTHKNGSQVLATIRWEEFLGYVSLANEACAEAIKGD